MTVASEAVFLLDVDNTLLDNDSIVADLGLRLAGISVDRIGELINYDIRVLMGAAEAGSAA